MARPARGGRGGPSPCAQRPRPWHFGWERPHLDQPEAALQQLQALHAHCQALADDPLPENQAYAADKLGNTASIRALIQLRQQLWHAARDGAFEAVQLRTRRVGGVAAGLGSPAAVDH